MTSVDALETPVHEHRSRQRPSIDLEPSRIFHGALIPRLAGWGEELTEALGAADSHVASELARYSQAAAGNSAVAERIAAASQRGGVALDQRSRRRLERSFGQRLNDVRVHDGPDADQLSRALGTEAFTSGQDIFFRAGSFQPRSVKGLHVLAHEIAHTIQQAEGQVDGTEVASGVSLSDPTDRFEKAAEASARCVADGREVGDLGGTILGSNEPHQHSLQRFGEWFFDMTTDPSLSGPPAAPPPKNEAVETHADRVGSVLDLLGTGNDVMNMVKEAGLGSGTNPVFGQALNLATGFTDFRKFEAQGQGVFEAGSSAGGKFLGTEATKYAVGPSPTDMAVNAIDNIAKLGLPAAGASARTTEAVTDYTGMAADLTPTKFGGAIGSNLLRYGYNALTGDDAAIERQGADILKGKSGSSLQGWGMIKSMLGDVFNAATSDEEYDFEQSLFKTAKFGENSAMDRMGSAIGDEVYGIVNNDPSKSMFADAASTYQETGYGLTDWLSDEWERF